MKKILCLWVTAAGVTLLAGCGRTVATTEIRKDGSWQRWVKFRMQSAGPGVTTGPSLAEAFVLPAGAPWKVTRGKENDEEAYTATRSVARGETLRDDISVRGQGKAAKTIELQNEVTVRDVAPGRLEYREVLRWRGEVPKELQAAEPDQVRAVKAALPPALATDALSKSIALALVRDLWMALLGPPDPLLSQAIMHPDLAERRMRQRVGIAVEKVLTEKLPGRLTEPERLATSRKLVEAVMATSKTGARVSAKAQPDSKEDQTNLVAMTFSVRPPGKVIATNGSLDPVTGEAYWGLYSVAAAMEAIVLTATCETSP